MAITLAAGVGGTTAQAFQFDGLSRATFAQDSAGGANADVTTVYDSLDRLLEESQTYQGNTRNVTNAAFTSVPVTGFTFPDDRQLTNGYDPLYRRTQVQETSGATNIASWQFFGAERVAEVTLGNGLICTWMNNARTHSAVQAGVPNPAWGDPSSDRLGYDGSGRAITKRYLAGGISGGGGYNTPTAVVGCTTEYDRAGNKFFERHLHAENRSHLYEPFDANQVPQGGYDSLDRLRLYQRGNLASTGGFNNAGGGSITTPIALPGTDNSRTYELDGAGNWRRTVFTPEASPSSQTEVRQHNGLNQITRIQNAAAQTNLSYDGTAGHSNGNLGNDGTRTYTWDALNRLLQVNLASSGALLAQYAYDALNRRIRKVVSNGGLTGDIPNGTTDFLYSGWQCVEEHDGSDNPTTQYVWGIYLDEIIQQQLLVSLNGFSAGAFYPLQDLLYRTTGFADSNRVVREAYDTDAYGNTLIFRNGGSPPAPIVFDSSDSQVDYPTCPFLFTGQRFDAETALYYYKRRFCLPPLGRFLSRDPKEFRASDMNLYRYVLGHPTSAADPTGEDAPGCDLPEWVGGKEINTGRTPRDRCLRQCCAKHDEEYHVHGCTAASWGWNVAGAAGGAAVGIAGSAGVGTVETCHLGLSLVGWFSPCASANNEVVGCFTGCAMDPNYMDNKPEWYCAQQGRYITIGPPGPPVTDFKTLDDAKAACTT